MPLHTQMRRQFAGVLANTSPFFPGIRFSFQKTPSKSKGKQRSVFEKNDGLKEWLESSLSMVNPLFAGSCLEGHQKETIFLIQKNQMVESTFRGAALPELGSPAVILPHPSVSNFRKVLRRTSWRTG